jgi:hypothetical protein
MKLLRRIQMKNPTHQELFDYIDGTLPEVRRREIDRMASQYPALRKEIESLTLLDSVIRSGEILERTSSHFTADVMKDVLPGKSESLLFSVLKNSSNVFAMVIVVALIVISFTLVPNHSVASSSNIISQSMNTFTNLYQSAGNLFSQNTKEYVQPVNTFADKGIGKLLFIGLGVLFGFGLLDDFLRKKLQR